MARYLLVFRLTWTVTIATAEHASSQLYIYMLQVCVCCFPINTTNSSYIGKKIGVIETESIAH